LVAITTLRNLLMLMADFIVSASYCSLVYQ
jgi:hypothetical protein